MYTPKPVLMKKSELSVEIQELVEKLAENAHDIWAEGKISNGWVYGKELDKDTKKHPNLVPYEDLSETEKDYDREMVVGTISYLIRKKPKECLNFIQMNVKI
jgi:hypothetical protein